ncbi:hypothetical protein CLAFUW4_03908 [Fulvia fulva]|uniref:NAD binding Rossmann fold oxidoreductase n=1 Tax=Passalora fulva TaxID=5499 RepID=A0A9Q8L9Z4_PASFU|nr:uncharacterized protein CLAFUR5_03877 [Fulvia fulva]KAK4632202.1 hypothetical protein CLAFUR4_03896 [Fulvia fulva]KAK4633624.1 hypothetical protein CLAFUR0_03895 [Fulvia fulva]UJO13593.1 hypothetical protein CLAFUR5_03877 [Fulvia fulva]WPV11162.1 hypothetical protein CLAFUW4_03908 [Fulvia fulva]WPV26517.1 hypothetical protein CLAFUW7_03899 [Fulvia fulva]
MASKPFNVAVVGYGLSAKVFHIPLILALSEDFKLYGIVQRTPKPDDDAAKDHQGIKSWRSVDEVYADPEVDVVIVTTTPETHFDMAKKSMESGKNVVVEKPFVPTAKEAQELADISKKTGKKLAVYQNRRWDADFLTLKKIMADGDLGEISEFETHFDRHRPDPPPAGSWKSEDKPAHGALYDLGTHLIDQVYSLFGMPKRVTGFVGICRRGVNGGAADSITVLLHYPGPILVTVKAGVVSPEEEQLRYWVRGTKGSFKKFHLDVQEDQLRLHGIGPGHKDFGVDPESHYGTLVKVPQEKATPQVQRYPTVTPATYVEYYRVFGKALRGEGEVPVRAEEAADVLRIIEGVLVSSREGRTVEF